MKVTELINDFFPINSKILVFNTEWLQGILKENELEEKIEKQ